MAGKKILLEMHAKPKQKYKIDKHKDIDKCHGRLDKIRQKREVCERNLKCGYN